MSELIDRKETPLLFDGEVILQITSPFLPDMYKTPFRIKQTDLEHVANRLEKNLLIELVSKMLEQRFQNYKHSDEHVTEMQFRYIQEAREKVIYYQSLSLEKLKVLFVEKVLPTLRFITPNPESKFFKNFKEKVDSIDNYLNPGT
jgi:hypothetical protein